MFPESFENFSLIEESDLIPLEVEMQELTDAINAIPTKMEDNLINVMYGKMEIHDNMMDIYNTKGDLIRTFNLYDYTGMPTTTSGVFKREIKED